MYHCQFDQPNIAAWFSHAMPPFDMIRAAFRKAALKYSCSNWIRSRQLNTHWELVLIITLGTWQSYRKLLIYSIRHGPVTIHRYHDLNSLRYSPTPTLDEYKVIIIFIYLLNLMAYYPFCSQSKRSGTQPLNKKPCYFPGGGQKLCSGRGVLPVADNIFKWKFFAFVITTLFNKRSHAQMTAYVAECVAGRTSLPVRSFCPPPVISEWIRNVLIYPVCSILWGSSDNYTNAKHEPCSNFLSTTVKYTDFLLSHWVSDSMAVRELTHWVRDSMAVREPHTQICG